MKTRSPYFTIGSLLLGALLFALIVWRTGAGELWGRVRALPAGFGWVLLVSGLRPLVRTYAWLRCLPPTLRRGNWLHLWRARLIGDAVGTLTTAGPLLAEPARLAFLGGRLPLATATASLSLEFLSYFLSACVVMLLGLLALLSYFALNSSLRLASLLSAGLLGAALLASVVVVVQRWSLVRWLQMVVEHELIWLRLSPALHKSMRRQLARLRLLERHIFNFYRRRPLDFILVVGSETSFHLLGVLEIWLTLRLFQVSASGLTLFIFEAVNRLINVVFAFVPIKLGVDEASTGLLAQVLGLAAVTGVTLALYRKIRVLFWTLIGMVLLALTYRNARASR